MTQEKNDNIGEAVQARPPTTPAASIPNAPDAPTLGLAVNDRDAAALMGVSRSHWRVLVRYGRAPAPVKMARSSRWRRLELIAWLNAGCPPRHRWKWTPDEGGTR